MDNEQRIQFLSWEPCYTEKDTYLATFKIGEGAAAIYEFIFYRPHDVHLYTIYSPPNSKEACAAWLIDGPGSQDFIAYYGIARDP